MTITCTNNRFSDDGGVRPRRSRSSWPALAAVLGAVWTCLIGSMAWAGAPTTDVVVLRGHPQIVRTYGRRGGPVALVSSGDGGWIHLAPHVADLLAARGFFVVGFDVKGYLSSFTTGNATLRVQDEPDDYLTLIDYAARGTRDRPLLVGVSEGAGLSVLAATDSRARARIGGVVALGLPDVNELGWRWRDSLIYLTHAVPNEPTFETADLVERMSPVPLAAIHSTQDEFVSLSEISPRLRGSQAAEASVARRGARSPLQRGPCGIRARTLRRHRLGASADRFVREAPCSIGFEALSPSSSA